MANKLELTWVGKEHRINVEPRLLVEDSQKSHVRATPGQLPGMGHEIRDNMLIHGDNLMALKALEAEYSGKVKCIYIDPPYNTGSAFEHYDDNVEHSQWLNLMRPRLEILRNLLSDDGSIWISIDDDEQAYLKVLCDEVFTRASYIAAIVWQKRTSPDMRGTISDGHDYLLVYAKNAEIFKRVRNKLPLSDSQEKNYSNPDNDPRGAWTSADFTAQGYRPNQMYTITTPGGATFSPPDGKCWKNVESVYFEQLEENRFWFGADGKAMPRRKTFLSEHDGVVPWTWWTNKEVGHNQEAKKEILALFGTSNVFDTPKPERLIHRVLTIASNPGDLILDSFLGSGTTAAVAHKMGRRWIGVEMGEHVYSHCKVRIDRVVNGEDTGGITRAVNWKGGGGYKFYELASTLINTDAFGEAVINRDYSPDMLAAAVALHEGFRYAPSGELFWKQSIGNKNSFLFVTTSHVNAQYLDSIRATMSEGEFLVIACKSYDKGIEKNHKEIALKKIPQMLLEKCEFGVADYQLNIVNPPVYEDEEGEDE